MVCVCEGGNVMENIRGKKIVSLLLIIAMFCTVFAVPFSGEDNAVSANVKQAKNETITVSLNPAGGKVSVATITATENGKYTGLPVPTREGYKFLGWFASNGAEVKNGMTVNLAYTSLTAKWKANQYTVKYNKNKGKLSKKSKKVTFGNKYGSLPNPKRSGYKFLGWHTKKKGGAKITKNTKVNTAKTHTIYARWGKITRVSFNANGGTVSKKSKKITQGKKYGSLPKPKKSGYVFKGWYTKKKGGSKVTKNTIVKKTKKSTLYARWVKAVKVSFDATGGYVSKSSKKVGYKSTYGTMPTAYRSSESYGRSRRTYRFLGWYTEEFGGMRVMSSTKVTNKSDHKLYAHWLIITTTFY